MDIVTCMNDPALFGRWFKGESWRPWKVGLAAMDGLPIGEDGAHLYRRCTGRSMAPTTPAREAWYICSRRSGKTRIATFKGMHLACFRDYRTHLAPGEVATVALISPDRRQSRTMMRYMDGFFEHPMLASLVTARTQDRIELSTRVVIEIHTCSFRSTRGYTLAAVIADEVCFWRSDESANPDAEILAAVRPGLATIPGAQLICISSPWARRGAAWDAYRKHFGKDGAPVFVWQADTRTMNPTVPEHVINDAYEHDPASAAAEWGGLFRSDLEQLFNADVLAGLVEPGVTRRPPVPGTRYHAFADPAGGGADAFAFGCAHYDRASGRAVLDVVEEWRGSPAAAVKRAAGLLEAYGLRTVSGDAYAAGFVLDAFKAEGVTYQRATRNRSEIYLELLHAANAGELDLLDDDRLLSQLQLLERKTGRLRDVVDHPRGAHDDRANAAAGALVEAREREKRLPIAAPIECGRGPSKWAIHL